MIWAATVQIGTRGIRGLVMVVSAEGLRRPVPLGLDASRWVTRRDCRLVLVVVHTATAGRRLLDVVPLVASDFRVQVVFTTTPDVFSEGAMELLRGLGGAVVGWEQATSHRFDLAVAAASGRLHELHAPVVVMPHGVGHSRVLSGAAGVRRNLAANVYGLDAQRLLHNGALVPSAIVLSHEEQLARLASACPEAVPAAVVVGDPCRDRMAASVGLRDAYREALGVAEGQKLVVAVSTWRPGSLFGRSPELLLQLVTELPQDEYRVAVALHPNVWVGHGAWQVWAWLEECRRRGLAVIGPGEDWRPAAVAADWVIGDHGSATLYAALAGVPLLLATFADNEIDPASPLVTLAATAPRLRPGRRLLPQLERAAREYRAEHYAPIVRRISSQPGRFNRNMRRLLYRLLGLPQPATVPVVEPIPAPARPLAA